MQECTNCGSEMSGLECRTCLRNKVYAKTPALRRVRMLLHGGQPIDIRILAEALLELEDEKIFEAKMKIAQPIY